jgi:hypothetical protein
MQDADGDGRVSVADVLSTLGRHVIWDAHTWYTVIQVSNAQQQRDKHRLPITLAYCAR